MEKILLILGMWTILALIYSAYKEAQEMKKPRTLVHFKRNEKGELESKDVSI